MIDISKITDYLYVGSKVGKDHADELKVMNFGLIISMIGQSRPEEVYYTPPFKTLWIRAYDTFFTPISRRKLLEGVQAAIPVIDAKGKVLVFCLQGRRRSVTMAAAILIAMGYTSDQAAEMLTGARAVADPRRWYVRRTIRSFEKLWRRIHAAERNVH
jgi:protein tyrosine phosphatase (PTP) superfamily phosphohydrolase (DUF442 family)